MNDSLKSVIKELEAVKGLTLLGSTIGILSCEESHQFNADNLEDMNFGINGELKLSFENNKIIFISWNGTSKVPGLLFCTDVSSTSFHRHIEYVQIPKDTDLYKCKNNKLNSFSIFGDEKYGDPLALQLVFPETAVRIGTFDYLDVLYIKKSKPTLNGSEEVYECLWPNSA